MSQTGATPGPNDPAPNEDPTHDVPVYPEHDPPPETETALKADKGGNDRRGEHHGHGGDTPPGESEEDDVDEDDLDPQKSHSPPDVGPGRVIFDENRVPG